MTTPADQPVAIRLEDLIAINREIAALIRAGIPLELGLRTFAGGLSSRLGRLADRIANRLSHGESPTDAFRLEGGSAFPVYSAVIDAGLQSGRLPEVLEAVAASAEVLQETRRQMKMALIYPIIVGLFGYAMFLFFVSEIVPRYLRSVRDFGFEDDPVFRFLSFVHDTSRLWVWGIPCALFVLYMIFRLWIRRRGLLQSFTLGQVLSRAQFADLLQIQVEHGLPIADAFRRAADGTGDRRLKRLADKVCPQLEQGVPLADAITEARSLPPIMRWMLATGDRQGTLSRSLALMRDSFRRRANVQSQMLKVWVPSLFTVLIGGGFGLMYALLFFLPLRALWQGLMRE